MADPIILPTGQKITIPGAEDDEKIEILRTSGTPIIADKTDSSSTTKTPGTTKAPVGSSPTKQPIGFPWTKNGEATTGNGGVVATNGNGSAPAKVSGDAEGKVLYFIAGITGGFLLGLGTAAAGFVFIKFGRAVLK